MSQQQNTDNSLLNCLRVASPCNVSWQSMEGGEIVRFCSHCKLNVYNLSAMPAAAAEEFLRNNSAQQGRTCIRFYRRHDGTLLTRDCPVGLAAFKAHVAQGIMAAASLAAALFLGLFTGCNRGPNLANDLKNSIRNIFQPPNHKAVMGRFCPPPLMPANSPNPDQVDSANDLEISLE